MAAGANGGGCCGGFGVQVVVVDGGGGQAGKGREAASRRYETTPTGGSNLVEIEGERQREGETKGVVGILGRHNAGLVREG